MIPYGKQHITEKDIDAVLEVLKSDFLTQGPKVPDFEALVAKKVGAQHAVAVNSATSALHIACLALGLQKGDLAWTSPISFVASANCVLYAGAEVDFVDIDQETFNICPIKLEEKLIEAAKVGRLPKIVIAVHMCGQSADMAKIHELSIKYNFKIIEDASHAIGGRYDARYIGNCRYSEITIFSFHPVKIITTAEGGIVTTNDPQLAEKMSMLRSHGVTRNQVVFADPDNGLWYYEQHDLGFNYRMTELQAALGISQLERLDDYVAMRNNGVQIYYDLLSDMPVKLPRVSDKSYSSWHLFVIRVESENPKMVRAKVFAKLREEGIGVNVHYIPIHLQPYYQKLGFKKGDFPEAEKYYDAAISIPLYAQITEKEQRIVVDVLQKALAVKG